MDEETRQRVASKGGNKVLEKYGHNHFSEIGKKGARAMLAKHGREHMAKIGTIGGSKSKIRAEGADGEDSIHPEEERGL